MAGRSGEGGRGKEWGQSESSGLLAGAPRRPTGSTLYTSLDQPPAALPFCRLHANQQQQQRWRLVKYFY